ncbi:MAG: F0F1 ATP synthase subunit delta [Acidiferrobacter sp.]
MNDETVAVARPYARALLAASGDQKVPILACLLAAAEVLSDPRMAALAVNPGIKDGALAKAFAFDGACAPVAHLIALLIENDRLAALPSIAAAFAVLKDESENRARVTVTSALPLTAAEVECLRAALARRSKSQIDITVETDARLLAGVIVQQGDMVLDGSVRGRLAALAHALSPF